MAFRHYEAGNFSVRQSASYLVRRTSNLMLPRLEALFAAQGFTFVQWCVLMSLRDGLASRAAEIARNLNYDSGALTRVLDQLEARGLIERSRSAEDRRTVELALTADGRSAVERLVPPMADFLNELFRDFTPAEMETLRGLLDRIIARLAEEGS
jgi:DNA-binding MarR family transcriptional regulator